MNNFLQLNVLTFSTIYSEFSTFLESYRMMLPEITKFHELY